MVQGVGEGIRKGRRGGLQTLVTGIVAGSMRSMLMLCTLSAITFTGCSEKDQFVTSGVFKSNNKEAYSVRVYHHTKTTMFFKTTQGTKIIFLDASSPIPAKVIYDASSGRLNDENGDYVQYRTYDRMTLTYAFNYYINEKGERIEFSGNSSKGLKNICRGKLKEEQPLYRRIMTDFVPYWMNYQLQEKELPLPD